MKADLFAPTGRFMYAQNDYEKSKLVVLGIPMDYTVSFLSGTRDGADGVRKASTAMEEYSPKLHRNLTEIPFVDLGNIHLPVGNAENSLKTIEEVYDDLLADEKIPFAFGGEHLVTLGIIRSMVKKYPDLVMIHLDAHGDMREDFFNEPMSHATVINHASKLLQPKHCFQVGIRSGPMEEFMRSRERNQFFPFRLEEAIPVINEFCKGKPVYITLDVDVLDPAHAPGVGTAEPQGVTSRELFDFIYGLELEQVVGIDVVEISPVLDSAMITSVVGANLLREMVLKFF